MLLTTCTSTSKWTQLFLFFTALTLSLSTCCCQAPVNNTTPELLPLPSNDSQDQTTGDQDDINSNNHNQVLNLEAVRNNEKVVPDCGYQSRRLPVRIKPVHYGIFLVPDLESLSYEGAVQINLQVSEQIFGEPQPTVSSAATADYTYTNDDNLDLPDDDTNKQEHQQKQLGLNQIALHADDSLRVERVWFRDLGVFNASEPWPSDTFAVGKYVGVAAVCRDPKLQLLVVTLEEDLQPGARGQLHLTFGAPLSNNMRGFYRSAYLAGVSHNETEHMAVTQFQATQARKAFPCFDEPALKATYELILLHSSKLEALANTEPLSKRQLNVPTGKLLLSSNQTLVHFAPTPPMSSYLLAFAVGRFDHLERTLLDNKLKVRVFTVPGRKHEARLALETACRAILMLQDYFKIDYPLTKLDLLAVPDFEAGAMENWGLITFKDSQLLYDELDASPETSLLVKSTVVHELAHQWFGNLVTMEWWNELWLNEGFATWMEYEMLARMDKSLEMPIQYLLDSHIHALTEDSFRSAHAVRPTMAESEAPDDIEELFDAISYNKAAAIIRQLNMVLRPSTFRMAIQNYLSAHMYACTNTNHLASRIEAFYGYWSEPGVITLMLESWLSQAGHPLVSVSLDEERNELLLKQERFISNVANLSSEETNQRWLINVNILIGDSNGALPEVTTINHWMRPEEEKKSERVELPAWFQRKPPGRWVKLNALFSGLYRVHYSEQLWLLLRDALEHNQLDAPDLVNLVDDTHALVLARRYPAERLVELLTWCTYPRSAGDSSEMMWQHGAVISSMAAALVDLQRLFEHNSLSEATNASLKLTRFSTHLLKDMYLVQRKQQQVNGSMANLGRLLSPMDKLGAAAVMQALVHLDQPEAVRDALHLFEASASSGRPLPTYIRKPVYVAVARAGKEVHFERLMAMLNSTASREERTRLAKSIARARQKSRLERLWRWLQVTEPGELDGDALEILNAMLVGGAPGRAFVRHLLESELPALVKLNGQRPITGLIETTWLASGSSAEPEMKTFFERHKSVADWESSREFIEQSLAWQTALVSDALQSGRLEARLDAHLAGEGVVR